jgi:hypothetical protein
VYDANPPLLNIFSNLCNYLCMCVIYILWITF